MSPARPLSQSCCQWARCGPKVGLKGGGPERGQEFVPCVARVAGSVTAGRFILELLPADRAPAEVPFY